MNDPVVSVTTVQTECVDSVSGSLRRQFSLKRRAFALFGVSCFRELVEAFFTTLDKEMRAGRWNPEEKESLLNRLKNIVESMDQDQLKPICREGRDHILRLWYYSATVYYMTQTADKKSAQICAQAAYEIQEAIKCGHSSATPNPLIEICYHLVFGRPGAAREVLGRIQSSHFRVTARKIFEDHRKGKFFFDLY